MKKEDVLKKLESGQGDTDYVLRTSDEDKTFLENFKKSVIETELDPQVAEIHNRYDADLYELFGEKKKPGEKTYNFMKSKFKGLKEKAERVEQLESEVESLKKGSPELEGKMREIKSLQSQIDKIKQEYESKIDEMAKGNIRNTVKSEVERGLMNIKVKETLPKSVIQVYVDNVINDLTSKAEIREGKIVFLDAEGKALRDPATMAPYTAEALLKERMKEVIDTGRQVRGPGIQEPVTRDGKMNVIVPDYVTSRQKLGEFLVKELGIKNTTKEYRDLYSELGANLPAFDK